MYVDVENDKEEMGDRFIPIARAWGCEEAWRQNGVYLDDLDFGELLEKEAALESWVKAIAQCNLLIIDSWTMVLVQLGLDEDRNQDIATFMRKLAYPISKAGIPILILDNTGHDVRRSRGAKSKTAMTVAAYKVTGGRKIGPDRHGTLKLELKRSRSGRLAKVVEAKAGDGKFTKLTPLEGPLRDDKVTGRQLLIKQFLFERRGDDFQTVEIAAAVRAKERTVGRDLADLEKQGLVVRTKREGSRADFWMAAS
jgi:hypothetical protein